MPERLEATRTPVSTNRQLLDAILALSARLDRLDERLDRVIANQARLTEAITSDCARFTNALKEDLFRVYDDLDHDGGTNLPFGPVGHSAVELVGDRLRGRRAAFVPGAFVHGALGTGDTLWALTETDAIVRWNAPTGTWFDVPGGLSCISAPTPEIAWGTARDGSIYRWAGTGWQQVPGQLVWISAAADGTVVGCAGDQSIWRLAGPSHWTQLPGRMVRIAVRSASEMIGINAGDGIFIWNGADWVQAAGRAAEAAIGDGYGGGPRYYVANRAGTVYSSEESVPQHWGVLAEGAAGISASGQRLLIRRGQTLYVDPEI